MYNKLSEIIFRFILYFTDVVNLGENNLMFGLFVSLSLSPFILFTTASQQKSFVCDIFTLQTDNSVCDSITIPSITIYTEIIPSTFTFVVIISPLLSPLTFILQSSSRISLTNSTFSGHRNINSFIVCSL